MNRIIFSVFCLFLISSLVYAVDETDTKPTETQQRLMELGFRVFQSPVEIDDFSLDDLNGESIALSSLRGNLVFLNFWATWCPPCRAEMPSMQALYESLEDASFTIVAVDVREPKQTVSNYIEENGFTFPVLLDSTGRIGGYFGARSIPTTYLINPEGKAIAFLVGSRSWEDEEIETLFRTLSEG